MKPGRRAMTTARKGNTPGRSTGFHCSASALPISGGKGAVDWPLRIGNSPALSMRSGWCPGLDRQERVSGRTFGQTSCGERPA
jgi:hypothetical protein